MVGDGYIGNCELILLGMNERFYNMIPALIEKIEKSGYDESIKNLTIKIVQGLTDKNIGTGRFVRRLMRNIDKGEFLDVLMLDQP